MFHIGDKIVHPLHGAGIIADIVERTIDGVPARYFALRLALDDTEVFLPLGSCDRLGIRPVCTREQAQTVVCKLDTVTVPPAKSWNRRYRENMQRIRSGDLLEVAQVIKSLAARDRERGLSTGEKKMLLSARHIMESELAYALELSPEQAAALINEKLIK